MIIDEYLEYNEKLIEFLPSVLIFIAVSALIYITTTIIIDSKIRNLTYSIINEIKKKKR